MFNSSLSESIHDPERNDLLIKTIMLGNTRKQRKGKMH